MGSPIRELSSSLVGALVNATNLSGSARRLARLRSLFLPHQVLFFHVPKCAGTSLSHPFRVAYALSHFKLDEQVSRTVVSAEDVDRWMEYKRNLFLYHALAGVGFVQGHVPYDPGAFEALHGRAVFMTVLREPMDRVISHYHFDTRLHRVPFDEFLESPSGSVECNAYSHFFGGLPFDGAPPSDAHRDAAIEALQRFDAVGTVEEPEQMLSRIRALTGFRFRLPKRNVGDRRLRESESIGGSAMSRLRELCARDSEIYHAAQAMTLPSGSRGPSQL